jgi:hypothetical protein
MQGDFSEFLTLYLEKDVKAQVFGNPYCQRQFSSRQYSKPKFIRESLNYSKVF